jgi:hypothetical protein
VAEHWFHGGVRDLRPGDKLLPPSQTGAHSVSDVAIGEELNDRVLKVHRTDRVYLARDLMQARMFASLAAQGAKRRGGDLYEVTPDGPLEDDPDWLGSPGGSACVTSATVLRVIERKVLVPTPAELAALLALEASR